MAQKFTKKELDELTKEVADVRSKARVESIYTAPNLPQAYAFFYNERRKWEVSEPISSQPWSKESAVFEGLWQNGFIRFEFPCVDYVEAKYAVDLCKEEMEKRGISREVTEAYLQSLPDLSSIIPSRSPYEFAVQKEAMYNQIAENITREQEKIQAANVLEPETEEAIPQMTEDLEEELTASTEPERYHADEWYEFLVNAGMDPAEAEKAVLTACENTGIDKEAAKEAIDKKKLELSGKEETYERE